VQRLYSVRLAERGDLRGEVKGSLFAARFTVRGLDLPIAGTVHPHKSHASHESHSIAEPLIVSISLSCKVHGQPRTVNLQLSSRVATEDLHERAILAELFNSFFDDSVFDMAFYVDKKEVFPVLPF
jgi:hypothetical protein